MNRKRYVVLCNMRGEYKLYDTVKVRMSRMRQRVFTWVRIVEQANRLGGRMGMYTLTYDTKGTLVPAANWERTHVGGFIKRLRERMKQRLLAYAVVAELHKSGTMHYHVLVIYKGFLPFPDKAYNQKGKGYKRLWEWGLSSTERVVRSPYYICTYVGKEYQKDFINFPDGAHAWSLWIADSVLRETLRFRSLNDLQQDLVRAFGWGIGLAEYSSVKRDLDHDGWGYVGSYITEGLAKMMAGIDEVVSDVRDPWEVTDDIPYSTLDI